MGVITVGSTEYARSAEPWGVRVGPPDCTIVCGVDVPATACVLMHSSTRTGMALAVTPSKLTCISIHRLNELAALIQLTSVFAAAATSATAADVFTVYLADIVPPRRCR